MRKINFWGYGFGRNALLAALFGAVLSACGGGGGGPNLALKTCQDGTQIPENDICPPTTVIIPPQQTVECMDGSRVPVGSTCLKTCADNSRIPENDTCMKTCGDGMRIAETAVCMKTCADNSVIAETAVCMKTCADNSIIAETAVCMKTCADNSIIAETAVCMKDCGNGVMVPETQNCPPPPPPDMKTCMDGSTIPATAVCMKTCADNSVIAETAVCMKTCADNSVIAETAVCMKTCADNSIIAETAVCMKTCADNSRVPVGDICTKLCTSTGQRIPENNNCPEAHTLKSGCTDPHSAACYNTNEYIRSTGLRPIHAAAGYAAGAFGQEVTVAIVDSGMLTSHIKLRGNVVAGYDYGTPANRANMTDPDGHGTAVGGVVAAVANGSRYHGVAPQAKLMPLKIAVDSAENAFNSLAAFSSWRHAINRGVGIINNSFGGAVRLTGMFRGTTYVTTVPDRFRNNYSNRAPHSVNAGNVLNMMRNRDVVMVWAAGNEGWNTQNGLRVLCRAGTRCNRLADLHVPTRAQFNNEFTYGGQTFAGRHGAAASMSFSNPQSRYPIYAAGDANANNYESTGEVSHLMSDANAGAMIERWLAVVATHPANNAIAQFSNGCGDAKPWCLAAPGENIRTAGNDNDNEEITTQGTSHAAPHVSGALAVLQSNNPNMRTPLIRAILLTTATPLGSRIGDPSTLDDIYGWGLLNISAALSLQNKMTMLASPLQQNAAPLAGAAIRLPPQMKHLKPQLQNAAVAVGGIGDIYYNMPLSDIAHVAPPTPNTFGDAAKDMLSDAKETRVSAGLFFAATDPKTNQFQYAGAEFNAGPLGEWQLRNNFCDDCETSAWQEWNAWNKTDSVAPLFANAGDSTVLQMQGEGLIPFAATGGGDAPWNQFGFRWNKNFARFGIVAEMSEINENNSFMGANFGTLGRATGKSNEARFLLRGDLLTNLRGFAEYRQARGDADIGEGGFLSAADGLRAESWSAGLEWRNVLSGKVRLTAKRAATFTGGRAVLNYTEADGDFTRAFYAGVSGSEEYKKEVKQTLHARQTELDFGGGKTPLQFSLGYARELQNGGAFAIAAEMSDKDAALSAQFQLEF